jgi:NACHT domain
MISDHVHAGMDVLLEGSAPSAFHNSGERFDPPKCHPNTRTHILTKIMNWIIGEVGWDEFIMWLYGPAGAGKSAIAQTIAERCHARHLLLASFFFSRTDPKRNNVKPLIASIAYQITLNLPQAKDAIEAAVERDPGIFQCSIKAQLTALIIDPLTKLSKNGVFQSTPVPNLIIIDGLDECHGQQVQQHILHAVSSTLQPPLFPLKFLICSRAESHLTLEFTSLTPGGMVTRLSLDDGYEQNADIERYLTDSFCKISTTHPLKEHIPPQWPTHKVLSTLVQKSSGQFIYAATVIKYVSSNRHQPTRRLEIVLGIQPLRNDRPFSELDALYLGILSSIQDVKATLRLLGVLILTDLDPKTPEVVGEFMFLDSGEVQRLLLDLASVVECLDKKTEIRMRHTSFLDFLRDRSRSEKYYIDSSMMHADIAQLCLSHIRVHDSEKCESSMFLAPSMAYSFSSCLDKLVV